MTTLVNPFINFKASVIEASGLRHDQIDHERVAKDYDMMVARGIEADQMAIALSAQMQVMLHEIRGQREYKFPVPSRIAKSYIRDGVRVA